MARLSRMEHDDTYFVYSEMRKAFWSDSRGWVSNRKLATSFRSDDVRFKRLMKAHGEDHRYAWGSGRIATKEKLSIVRSFVRWQKKNPLNRAEHFLTFIHEHP